MCITVVGCDAVVSAYFALFTCRRIRRSKSRRRKKNVDKSKNECAITKLCVLSKFILIRNNFAYKKLSFIE